MLTKELREVVVEDANKVIDDLRDAIAEITFDDVVDSTSISEKLMKASCILANLSQEVAEQ